MSATLHREPGTDATLPAEPESGRDLRRTLRRLHGRTQSVTAVLLALAIAAVAWQQLSVSSGGWVPSLADIGAAVGEVRSAETLVSDIGTTLRRVIIVWAGAVACGLVIGVAAGFSWRVRAFLRPILAVALAIPDLVYIIMTVLVLGLAESSGLVALVLAISPLVANVVMASVLERNRGLDEMARAYRMSRPDYVRHVLWWQLRPAVRAGVRTAFAFSWKLMVLLEALAFPTGVGYQIHNAFKFLRPAEMIVWALVFTLLMKAIEVIVIDRLLTDRARRR